ncbi:type II toxin-antitoxin system death-on-curing family toxin [Acaryochloris sp. IP29b_bin.148]|uniref:type II toxin-antitoxin system death-on-curing family toxin n=1 Tax=Acaryochloris sp. IP29b_bin.148 TaxID=2969218 RepID=UPI0026144BD8|nr:type II toxin-antitoxin system death-on-curing family toxin [Acaryochloris sp. IP29b_bin.148]
MPTPKFLNLALVLKIHSQQIDKFGGSHGIRDQGLLESALAQPQASFSGELLHSTIYEQAAVYLYHLVMNHPFIDGNKRTAFAVMDTFIRFNGYSLILENTEVYEIVLQVAKSAMGKDALTIKLRENIKPNN